MVFTLECQQRSQGHTLVHTANAHTTFTHRNLVNTAAVGRWFLNLLSTLFQCSSKDENSC